MAKPNVRGQKAHPTILPKQSTLPHQVSIEPEIFAFHGNEGGWHEYVQIVAYSTSIRSTWITKHMLTPPPVIKQYYYDQLHQLTMAVWTDTTHLCSTLRHIWHAMETTISWPSSSLHCAPSEAHGREQHQCGVCCLWADRKGQKDDRDSRCLLKLCPALMESNQGRWPSLTLGGEVYVL
jgi:hypothetical protein